MYQYQKYLAEILQHGVEKGDRTGTGTLSMFGGRMRFNLEEGFPILTTKKVSFKNVATELLWFLRGGQHKPGAIDFLHERDCHIWDEWVKDDGSFGRIYGTQWRDWHPGGTAHATAHQFAGEHLPGDTDLPRGIDQLQDVIERLRTNPDDRRLIVSTWNPTDIPEMALPPCHMMFQFWTREREDGTRGLSCQMYQRSCDSFLGVPYNISSYALLIHMVAHVVGMVPEELVWIGGDCHIYSNHMEQVMELMSRRPMKLPILSIKNDAPKDIDELDLEHFELVGYESHDAIRAPVAV